MTADGYRAVIHALGLTPCKASYNGTTLHQTRDGQFAQVPDPEGLSPEERRSMIELIKFRLGIENH